MLTFFCELESQKLTHLFNTGGLMEKLQKMKAAVSLGLIDLSPERAEAVKKLNKAGIPVTAWLLLPKDQGYWFNIDNVGHAIRRYGEFRSWTVKNKLEWASIGLDIEPDINKMNALENDLKSGIRYYLHRFFSNNNWQVKAQAYQSLVTQIRLDGYTVESYQFPVIVDERKAGSQFFPRSLGILDLPVDREVLMLYSSFIPTYGTAMLESYAVQAQGVGIGITGGGVELGNSVPSKPLTWQQLSHDLLVSRQYCPNLYVFSLEGCLAEGYLDKLVDFNWHARSPAADPQITKVNLVRKAAQALLWLYARPWLAAIVAVFLFWPRRRKCC
ncbi:MAG TPA: hypothetical protein VN376_08710 [Longilinea sp.]|nr:hypothetical protein [Longilinea sp.]